jgi:hypothetical protein
MPMSLNTFRFEAKRFLNLLEEEQRRLIGTYKVFTEGKAIWPDQCRRAIAFLHKIEVLIEEFCILLEDPEQLPEAVISDRYPLLMTLQNITEEIKELIPLINRFDSTNEFSAKQTVKHQQTIQNKFRLLLKWFEEVMDILPELASFQKKQ